MSFPVVKRPDRFSETCQVWIRKFTTEGRGAQGGAADAQGRRERPAAQPL